MKRSETVEKNRGSQPAHLESSNLFRALFLTLKKQRDELAMRTGLRIQLPISFIGRNKEDWLNEAVGVQDLADFQVILKDFPVVVDKNLEKRTNVLLPSLDPLVLFGGYIAMLNFLGRARERGHKLRIILCDHCESGKEIKRIRNGIRNHPLIQNNLGSDLELYFARHNDLPIPVGPDDTCMSYSWVTTYLAHSLSQKINQKPIIYFIQEYEPIFYPNNSFRAIADGAYALPHAAVFNSATLANYFKDNSLGVFDRHGSGKYVSFEHVLSSIRKPTVESLSNRKTRKLLFYARPESHAARNLFAVGILAIREAISRGTFEDGNWEFYGIGSISFSQPIDLGNGHQMEILPRMSQEDYANTLGTFDLGMSLMYAPHPSVPPFEMAAAGMITVTTSYKSRSGQDMVDLSSNFIASHPDPQSIADGLSVAIDRIPNYEERVRAAEFPRSHSWKASFSDDFMAKFEQLIS